MHEFNSKFQLTTFIVFATAILLMPLSALANEKGTITLKDGTVYESVMYTVNSFHKTINFELESGKKAVSFTVIKSIVDEKGREVTKSVLGEYYDSGEGAGRKSGAARANQEPLPKLWEVGFQFGSHYCLTAGDYYDQFTSDIGFDGSIIIALNPSLGLRGTVSKAGIKLEDDSYYVYDYGEDLYERLITDEVTTWRYLLSLQYNYRPDRQTPGSTEFYLYGGLGAVSHKISGYKEVGGYEWDTSTRVSNTETKFATTLGAGMTQLFSPTMGFYLGADFDVLYLGQSSDEVYSGDNFTRAYQFDLKLGLTAFMR
jgi:hypothetical protein